jgi:DNA-binding beta-propeller fold protein YncE
MRAAPLSRLALLVAVAALTGCSSEQQNLFSVPTPAPTEAPAPAPAARSLPLAVPGVHDPGSIVPDPATGLVYVADADALHRGRVTILSAATHRVVGRIELPGAQDAGPMALDQGSSLLFVTSSDGRLFVVDALLRRVVRSLRIGNDPAGVAVARNAKMAFVSDADGIAMIDTESLLILDRVRTESQGMVAIDEDAGLLFAVNEGNGTVTVLDLATHDVIRVLPAAYVGDRWEPRDGLQAVETLVPGRGSRQAFGYRAIVDPATGTVFITCRTWMEMNGGGPK